MKENNATQMKGKNISEHLHVFDEKEVQYTIKKDVQ